MGGAARIIPVAAGTGGVGKTLVQTEPDALVAQVIRQLAERVHRFRDAPVADGARRVAQPVAELREAARSHG
jgi:hypothetical protein